jgi:hypothetical protein
MARTVVTNLDIRGLDTALDSTNGENVVLDKSITATVDRVEGGSFTQAAGAGAESIFGGGTPANWYSFNIVVQYDANEPVATKYVTVVVDGAATFKIVTNGAFTAATSCTVQTATANSAQIHFERHEVTA